MTGRLGIGSRLHPLIRAVVGPRLDFEIIALSFQRIRQRTLAFQFDP
jgi:hypothetical protein